VEVFCVLTLFVTRKIVQIATFQNMLQGLSESSRRSHHLLPDNVLLSAVVCLHKGCADLHLTRAFEC
jgi:hypothetical protein